MKLTQAIQVFTLSLTITTSAFAWGGGADIGGGDTVRAYFLNVGDSVMSYLTTTTEGQKLVADQGLKAENLQKSLDVNLIKVVDTALIDRTGSLVEALGEPGAITLNKLSWAQHLDHDNDVYFLVFHEMLRENGINDDNYVISKSLRPFPEGLKIKNSLTSKKPLIAEDSLSDTINKDQIIFGGPGCPSNSVRTFTRFDSATNQFEIYPNEMATVVGSNGQSFDRKSCQIAIPYRAKAGKKLIITQVDVSGDVDLEKLKTAKITVDTFAVGSAMKTQVKDIASGNSHGLSAGFLVRENLAAETACGGDGILRLNSNIILQDAAKETTAVVSYTQVSRITLSLKSVDCTSTSTPTKTKK
jgi:hypothetical protein